MKILAKLCSYMIAISLLCTAASGFFISADTSSTAAVTLGSATSSSSAVTAPTDSYTPPFDPQAEGVYVVNEDSGLVVYAKNADEHLYPASLTKIMTALLVLEKNPDLNGTLTMNSGIIQMLSGSESVVLGLVPGEQISLKDALYSVLLQSAGDCTDLVAEYVGGSVDGFVDMMNQKAAELGCTNTHFTNPHGLHDANHYSSPADMYKITAEAMKNATFRQIVDTQRYTIAATNKAQARLIISTNIMLSQNLGGALYYAPIIGIKTGHTTPAGPCFISAATKNGTTYTVVVMKATGKLATGAEDPNSCFAVTKQIYEWLFSNFKLQTVVTNSTVLRTLPVKYGADSDSVGLIPQQDFTALLPKGADKSKYTVNSNLPASLAAPIKAGDVIGKADIVMSGKTLGTINLVAAETINRSELLFILSQIGAVLTSKIIIVIGAIIILLIIAYAFLNLYQNRRHSATFTRKSAGRRKKKKRTTYKFR